MTQRKERALQALLTSRTKAEAAKAAGVGESTLREYLKDPEFSSAYKHAAAGIMDAATRQLQQSLSAAILWCAAPIPLGCYHRRILSGCRRHFRQTGCST